MIQPKRIFVGLFSACGLLAFSSIFAFLGCMHDADRGADTGPDEESQAILLYVGGVSKIAAYDLRTGEQKAGEITNVAGLTDMQALDDGTVLVNSGSKNQIVVFNGQTMLEKRRIESSQGVLKPTHGFLTTMVDGKQFFVSLFDGNGSRETNGVLFTDVVPQSATYLQRVGEGPLGIGHHKAAFSKLRQRASISNISDCNEVVAVLDFEDPSAIQKVATFSAADLGFDGSAPEKTCGSGGISFGPHGSATSPISGRAYHNLTGIGKMLSIDQGAPVPTGRLLSTQGKGGGYTKALAGTPYVYSLQNQPREGSATHPGSVCQVGQLVVIDGNRDSVINQVPVFLTGPDCTDSLPAAEKMAGLDHMSILPSARRLYILGGNSDAEGYSTHRHVFDLTDPENPKQLVSLVVGKSRGHHPETVTGDGRWLIEGDNLDNTVTVIEVATGKVVRSFPVVEGPSALTTFGKQSGPSHPTGPVE